MGGGCRDVLLFMSSGVRALFVREKRLRGHFVWKEGVERFFCCQIIQYKSQTRHNIKWCV